MESTGKGFDFTSAMRCLCDDMVGRMPILHHIDLNRVAINLCQARQDSAHGIYASLTPLRFEAGATSKTVRGVCWEVEPLCDKTGLPFLYLLSFYLPRFLQISLEENLSTVFHELWHISPEFNGDVRRHAGRCYAHGPSQQEYDANMDRLAQQWLARNPPAHLYEFLSRDFDALTSEFGPVFGTHWSAPKLVHKQAC